MKIIKKGCVDNKICCTECHCEYEYDYHDILTTFEFAETIYGQYEVNYIRCPICGKKKILSKEYVESKINIGISSAEEKQ